jgi:hypothetical protein
MIPVLGTLFFLAVFVAYVREVKFDWTKEKELLLWYYNSEGERKHISIFKL